MIEAIDKYTIEDALHKTKKNYPLTVKEIENLIEKSLTENGCEFNILSTQDHRGFNVLDWSIIHHNYHNVKILLEYLDTNNCETNCFIRLFRGVIGTPNKENILKLTHLLLKYHCAIPDDLDSNDNSPRMRDHCIEAKKILRDARPPHQIKPDKRNPRLLPAP